jgi:hypothetical protein
MLNKQTNLPNQTKIKQDIKIEDLHQTKVAIICI